MALPIRRSTPQPRFRALKPQLITVPLPASSGPAIYAIHGAGWPAVRRLRSRLVIPAPSAVIPSAATLAQQGVRRGPTKPARSRFVNPAPLASPQAPATLAARGHVWIPRPRITASRRVLPAPVVVAAAQPATLAQQGVKRPTPKPGRPRLTVAPLASPQAASTRVVAGATRSPIRPYRSRLVIPGVLTVAAPASPQRFQTILQAVSRAANW